MKTKTRLDELAEIVMGQAPPGDSYNTDGNGLPLIAGAGDFNGQGISPKKYTTNPSKRAQPGDLILGIRASIGEKRIADRQYALGRGVASIRPTQRLDHRYLWHWLDYVSEELASKGRGATFKQVNRQDIGELRIDNLPLSSQQRIARMLDKADALRAMRRRAVDLLDSLAQSLFYDMFDTPIESQWENYRFSELVTEFRYGTSNKSTDSGYPALRIPNVIGGGIDLTEIKTVPVSPHELERLRLQDGDLLFVRTNGSPENVGRCATFTTSNVSGLEFHPNEWIYASYLIRARLNLSMVDSTYIREFMLGPTGRAMLREHSKTSAGQFNINIDGLSSVIVPVPPIAAQRSYADKLSELAKHRAMASVHLARLDNLFNSLQSRAFRGELWQDDLDHLEGEGLS
ncbi:restriction endonuclease subunit S [Nocardia sp. NPDC056000]|uniref:restriction endonuclease subunit S n=1 Tax=Nocardia sp. NPDC056000 TaxID=3345674 RepID=UPI0035D9C8DE